MPFGGGSRRQSVPCKFSCYNLQVFDVAWWLVSGAKFSFFLREFDIDKPGIKQSHVDDLRKPLKSTGGVNSDVTGRWGSPSLPFCFAGKTTATSRCLITRYRSPLRELKAMSPCANHHPHQYIDGRLNCRTTRPGFIVDSQVPAAWRGVLVYQ